MNVLLAGVIDGHAHRKSVLAVLRDRKLRSTGVFQQPQLPVHLVLLFGDDADLNSSS